MMMIAGFAMLGAPGVALAGDNAAVEEYVLDIPGAGGKQHGDDPGGTGANSGLPPAAASALEALGEDGIAAAELAEATGPKRNAAGDDRNGGSAQAVAADADDSGVARVLTDLASGSDSGMGPALPIFLALALAAAVALVIRRRRGETSAQS
jgi:hypothetical protein